MSINASKARLVALTKELMRKWDRTREDWRDAKAGEFERNYLTELRASVDNAITVIDQLEQMTQKIRKDCE